MMRIIFLFRFSFSLDIMILNLGRSIGGLGIKILLPACEDFVAVWLSGESEMYACFNVWENVEIEWWLFLDS